MSTQVSFPIGGMQMTRNAENMQAALEIKGAADEINRNLSSLAQVAGVQVSDINIKVDKGLQGSNGTFDKYRARAYNDGKLYTVDFGVTDNNPLGMYLPSPYKSDKKGRPNLEIYNLQTGQNEDVAQTLGNSYRGGSNGGANQPQRPQNNGGGGARQPQQAQQPQQGGGGGGYAPQRPAQPPASQQGGGQQQQQPQQAQAQQGGGGGQDGPYAWQP